MIFLDIVDNVSLQLSGTFYVITGLPSSEIRYKNWNNHDIKVDQLIKSHRIKINNFFRFSPEITNRNTWVHIFPFSVFCVLFGRLFFVLCVFVSLQWRCQIIFDLWSLVYLASLFTWLFVWWLWRQWVLLWWILNTWITSFWNSNLGILILMNIDSVMHLNFFYYFITS